MVMKLLFINHMIAPHLLKNNCRIGRIIAFILMLLTCASMFFAVVPDASGQGTELAVAEKVVNAVQGKDINYVIAISGALSVGFSFWLVKMLISEKNKQIELLVKADDERNKIAKDQIDALRNLKDELKDRKCWYPQRAQGN